MPNARTFDWLPLKPSSPTASFCVRLSRYICKFNFATSAWALLVCAYNVGVRVCGNQSLSVDFDAFIVTAVGSVVVVGVIDAATFDACMRSLFYIKLPVCSSHTHTRTHTRTHAATPQHIQRPERSMKLSVSVLYFHRRLCEMRAEWMRLLVGWALACVRRARGASVGRASRSIIAINHFAL